jgi:AcrR family transcriptional regulator
MDEFFPKKLSKGDRRRLQIMNAAIQVFAEGGTDFISLEDVSRKAKISRPLLQHYFPDKKLLFQISMRFIRAQFQDLAIAHIQRGKTPKERVIRYLESTFEWLEKNRIHGQAWLFFFYACSSDAKLRKEHTEMTALGEARIVALIEAEYGKENLESKAKIVQRLITGALLEIVTEEKLEFEVIKSQTLLACLQIIEK